MALLLERTSAVKKRIPRSSAASSRMSNIAAPSPRRCIESATVSATSAVSGCDVERMNRATPTMSPSRVSATIATWSCPSTVVRYESIEGVRSEMCARKRWYRESGASPWNAARSAGASSGRIQRRTTARPPITRSALKLGPIFTLPIMARACFEGVSSR
jgi:hypothetical protein